MFVNQYSSFKDWRVYAGLSQIDCSQLFEVTLKTVNNWDVQKTIPAKAVFLYLAIYCGRLDFLGKAWTGFWLDTDCIVTPEGEPISAGEIRGAPWAYQALGIKRSFSRNKINTNEFVSNNKIICLKLNIK